MFTYQNFMAFVRGNGLARQNRFYVDMGVPKVLADLNGMRGVQTSDTKDFFIKGASIPGVAVSSETVRLTGEAIEVPYDRTFSQITLTFYVDVNLKVRRYFDMWIDKIQNPSSRVMSFYGDYITNISLFVLDINDKQRYRMTCFECWPKSVGALTVDNEQSGIMTMDITFEFRNYRTGMMAVQDYQIVADRQQRMLNKKVGGLGLLDSLLPEKYRGIILQNPANVSQYVNDPSAMSLIANDPIAMSNIVESGPAKQSLWGSDTALAAIGNSPIGWQSLRDASAHSIINIPNLAMGAANGIYGTYAGVKYISTGIGLDITEAKDTLLTLKDIRDGSIRPSTLGAATQGVFNTTSALGKMVSPFTGPMSITPTGEDVGGASASVGVLDCN